MTQPTKEHALAPGDRNAAGVTLYDPLADTPTASLYEKYRVLRETCPVYYSALRDAWCLSRYDSVLRVARDWHTFSNAQGVDLDVPADFFGAGDFLDTDPPHHDYLRGLVRDWFTPRGVRQLEQAVDMRVTRLLDAMTSGPVDLAADFAWQLPIWVICTLLGIPIDDLDLVRTWLTDLTLRIPGDAAAPLAAVEARDALHAYLTSLVQDRMRRPTDDVLSAMARAVAQDKLAVEDVIGLAVLLFSAGGETTASLLANGLILLHAHPDQQAAVRAGSVDLAAAIEEVLRYETPIQYLCRTAGDDVVLEGTAVPKGARVVLLYGSANRDERRYDAADKFDVSRSQLRHLAFGNGIHFCLGANLARLEAMIAFRRFFERVRRYEIVREPELVPSANLRLVASLPAVVTLR